MKNFAINGKYAAGTSRFLEVMANALELVTLIGGLSSAGPGKILVFSTAISQTALRWPI